MKATIYGVTYEGSEDEIRRIVENPPVPNVVIRTLPPVSPDDSNFNYPRNWDGSPRVTCATKGGAQ